MVQIYKVVVMNGLNFLPSYGACSYITTIRVFIKIITTCSIISTYVSNFKIPDNSIIDLTWSFEKILRLKVLTVFSLIPNS